jgi:hypothetical protein
VASKVGPWLRNGGSRFSLSKSGSAASLVSNASLQSNISTPTKSAASTDAFDNQQDWALAPTLQLSTTSFGQNNQALDKLRAYLAQFGYDGSNGSMYLSTTQIQRLKAQLKGLFNGLLNDIQLDALANDPSLAVLYFSCPNSFQYEWGVYCTPNTQWAIWEALDDRGERERELKAKIKASLGLEEPPTVYATTGSEYVGRKVRRQFGKRKVVGTITGWVAAEGDDPALWHIEHIDGDEEDLEEHEVLQCLVDNSEPQEALVDKPEKSPSLRGDSNKVGKSPSDQSLHSLASGKNSASSIPKEKKLSSGSTKLKASISGEDEWSEGEKSDDNMVIIDDEEVEETQEIVEPLIVRVFHGSGRNHQPMKPFMIGLVGLTNEIIKAHQQMIDVLKKRLPDYSKDIRKLWENSVRDAETLDELKDLLLVSAK